jgi:glycosyltransferase involved in cell wall biosynthesis
LDPRVVVIIGPPWPRSGAARVFQNEIAYYHARGYQTAFVIVPFHRAFMRSSDAWDGVEEGIRELGADQVFLAPLERDRYRRAKYKASLRHAFLGTTLDWVSAMAQSAHLPNSMVSCLQNANIELFHVNYVQALAFAQDLRKKLPRSGSGIPVILETHDVQSHLHQEREEVNPWTKKKDLPEKLLQSELSMLQQADALIHLSYQDARFFKEHLPQKPQVLALPTIDEAFVSEVRSAAPFPESIDLLFVGQNHAPNVAAVEWLLGRVWPLIAERRYNLRIVGPVDTLVRESFPELHAKYRSFFAGRVPDLPRYYRSARCVIAPMVSGSGTSIKTIEAMALGKPFVGTSKAFRGMPIDRIQAAGICAYDTPHEFAEAIRRSVSSCENVDDRNRAAYESIFSVAANFAARDQAFEAAMNLRKVSPFSDARAAL